MNNKAMALSTIAKYLIGIAFLVIVAAIFFIGPNALFTKIKEVIPRADTSVDRGSYDPGSTDSIRSAQDQARSQLYKLQENLAGMLQSSNPYCFYTMQESIIDPLQNYNIKFTDTDKGVDVTLMKEISAAKGTFAPASELLSIPDANLCVVYGKSQVAAFHEAWVGAGPRTVSSAQYQTVKELTIEKGSIIIPGSNGDQTLSFDPDKQGRLLVFAAGKNLCFVSTSSTWPTCKQSGTTFDQDCIANILLKAPTVNYMLFDETQKTCVVQK